MNCGVGCRRGLDPELLWLWHRLVATAPMRCPAWEPPYAAGAALEKAKRQKEKKNEMGNMAEYWKHAKVKEVRHKRSRIV